MPVKSLDTADKDTIIRQYQSKALNLKQIAEFWFTSPRTIGRILEERGIATPVPRLQGEAYGVMQLLAEHGMTTAADLAEVLTEYMTGPAVTPERVQAYLNTCGKAELIAHFHKAGLHKLADVPHVAILNKTNLFDTSRAIAA